MKTKLTGYAVELKQLTEADMEQVHAWRNLPEVREKMLNTQPIPWREHEAWYINMLGCDKQCHFKIIFRGKGVGVISVRATEPLQFASKAEIGIYIAEPECKGNLIAFSPSLLLIDYLFEALNFMALESLVRQDNREALRYNKVLGYKVTACDTSDLLKIELTPESYAAATKKIKAFLSRN
ncbi:GNAT family N-acetyltransferase [Pseudoalteromonas 'SMAR']|uniref:GNAT family N-acetyltransferase n=1 Tax=Pseudoalteromonas 'SMAR' TaxID=3416908 RepID=UPI003AF29A15